MATDTSSLTKVIVNCSSRNAADVGDAVKMIQHGIELVEANKVEDGAAMIVAGHKNLSTAKKTPTTVRAMTDAERAEHLQLQSDHLGQAIGERIAEIDSALRATDWTQIPDAADRLPAKTTVAQWAKYRAALHKLRQTITDPYEPIAWPNPPAPLPSLPA